MRFVPVKSVEQQSMLSVHRLREGSRPIAPPASTASVGCCSSSGWRSPRACAISSLALDDVLEDASNEMNHLARVTLQRAQAQWRELDAHMAWCDERIAAHATANDDVKRAGELMGVGPVGWQKAVVALANKNARILWAIMTKGTRFERNHKSEKPGPAVKVLAAPTHAQAAPAR